MPSHEGHRLDGQKPFGWVWRLELALMTELHARRKSADVALDRLAHLVWFKQPAVLGHHARRGVDLRGFNTGGEPHASNGQAESRRGLDHQRPRRARDVRVVEDDPSVA